MITMVKRKFYSQIAWIGVLVPLLTASVTLDKLLEVCEHCFPQP